MKYRELVARISEVTRTLAAGGSDGEFDPNSSKFRTHQELPDSVRQGAFLVIKNGPLSGQHAILDANPAFGVVRIAPTKAQFALSHLEWEIYLAGVSEEDVREVLSAFPDVIMECEEGEQVRTYLGTFRLTRRKRKRVKDPQGRWTFSEEKIVARIRPGKRLQREIEKRPSESRSPPELDLDEDP